MKMKIISILLAVVFITTISAPVFANTTLTKEDIIKLANEIKHLKQEVEYWKAKATAYKKAYFELKARADILREYVKELNKTTDARIKLLTQEINNLKFQNKLYKDEVYRLKMKVSIDKYTAATFIILAFFIGGKVL